ncbi:hypothetical protein GOV11_05245 [Candidatus Woesearchaeota archaeon]|nr:hypothetical protein [Candidatus Woesearchaeota archaeon]
MFNVKVVLGESKIHGIGLFADENIAKGALVYTVNPDLNLHLTQEEFSKLSDDEKNTMRHFGYFGKDKQWHLSFDNIRFCNHHRKGNVSYKDGKIYSVRAIMKDEEITQNYEEIEDLRPDLR